MIPDERRQVLLPTGAVGKKSVPLVVGLVEDQQPEAVGEVEHVGRVGIVAEANGVDADGPQDLQPLLDAALKRRSTQGAKIVVQADTFDDHAFAIQQETGIHIELDGPDAEGRIVGIEHAIAVAELAGRMVQLRSFERPEPRIRDREPLGGGRLASRRHFHGRSLLRDLLAIGAGDPDGQVCAAGLVRVVAEDSLNYDRRAVGAHIRHGYVRAPMGDAYGTGSDEPYMPVDATACVPPARLFQIVDAHRNHVVAISTRPRREVALEADVTVPVVPDFLPIHPHVGAVEDAVETEKQALAGEFLREAEGLAVPANPDGGESAGTAGRVVLLPGTFDTPVVRDVKAAPGAVVKVRALGLWRIAERELPAKVQAETPAGRLSRRRR